MSGTVTFTADEGDYVAANRLWHTRSPRQRWLFWLGSAGLALAVVQVVITMLAGGALLNGLVDASAIILFATIVFGVRASTPLMLPRQIRRMLRQHRALQDPMDIRWDAEGVYFAGSNGTANLAWDRLHRWLDDDATFVFLQSDRLMFVVPKRFLGTLDIDDLHAAATKSGLKQR